jgi:hypothetical protein
VRAIDGGGSPAFDLPPRARAGWVSFPWMPPRSWAAVTRWSRLKLPGPILVHDEEVHQAGFRYSSDEVFTAAAASWPPCMLMQLRGAAPRRAGSTSRCIHLHETHPSLMWRTTPGVVGDKGWLEFRGVAADNGLEALAASNTSSSPDQDVRPPSLALRSTLTTSRRDAAVSQRCRGATKDSGALRGTKPARRPEHEIRFTLSSAGRRKLKERPGRSPMHAGDVRAVPDSAPITSSRRGEVSRSGRSAWQAGGGLTLTRFADSRRAAAFREKLTSSVLPGGAESFGACRRQSTSPL